jgi:hypothetical protein
MRVMGVVMGLANRGMARQIQMGVIMDTSSQAFDALEARRPYPSIPVTHLAEVVKHDFGNVSGAPSLGVIAES